MVHHGADSANSRSCTHITAATRTLFVMAHDNSSLVPSTYITDDETSYKRYSMPWKGDGGLHPHFLSVWRSGQTPFMHATDAQTLASLLKTDRNTREEACFDSNPHTWIRHVSPPAWWNTEHDQYMLDDSDCTVNDLCRPGSCDDRRMLGKGLSLSIGRVLWYVHVVGVQGLSRPERKQD